MARSASILVRRKRALPRASSRPAPLPAHVAPMLAVATDRLPLNPCVYSFEWKWDGVRAICFIERGRMRLESRNLLEITGRYPELQAMKSALHCRSAILDGEVVALDDSGRPSFALLQRRMHIADPRSVARLVGEIPILYVLFDLLYADGRSLMGQPFKERRERLEEVTVAGRHWQVTSSHIGQGEAMLDAARQNGLEGIVAKRLNSLYEPGRRSPAWLKIKVTQRYHDEYREKIMELIEKKAKGEKVVLRPEAPSAAPKRHDLIAALEASLEKARACDGRHAAGPPRHGRGRTARSRTKGPP